MQSIDVPDDGRAADRVPVRGVDVEAEAVALARDVLDPRLLHVDEIDAGRELADRSIADGDVRVSSRAHTHRVELRLRPGLRAHARTGDRVATEVEGHVIGVDDEGV